MVKLIRRISLSTRILLAFLFLTVLSTATSGYSLMKHRSIGFELRLISRGYLKIAFAIVEMRTTQRLQTIQLDKVIEEHDEGNVRGWLSSVIRIRPVVLENLAAEVSRLLEHTSRPEEQDFLLKVKKGIEETQQLCNKVEGYYPALFTLLQQGISPEAQEVLKLVREQEAAIGSNLRHLQNISVQRIHAVTTRSEQAETRTMWLLSAFILLTVAMSLITTFLIHRLLRPLGELQKGVEIIGKGNLDYRVTVKREDEIGRFATQLNLMAEALQERDRRLILSEKLASIGKMASLIAHEVKNPLSSIGLNTEILREEARLIEPAQRREEILQLTKSISQEVDRVTNLIDHYLQLGRPPKPTIEETNLRTLLAEVGEFMAPEMKERSVEMTLELPEAPVVVRADGNQIKQVVINLLKNAIEAMDDSKPAMVRLKLEECNAGAMISISDTGRGMGPAELEHIFEPFYTSKKGGTGLGLAITRQIVLDHKGHIECRSEKGKGTEFRVILPKGS